jgi:hypothetical protein
MRNLSLLLALTLLAMPAAAIVIDDFTEGPLELEAFDNFPGVEEIQTPLAPASVLGGTRRVWLGGSSSGPESTRLLIDTTAGQLTLTSDVGSFGYLDLGYGSETPLGVDLTADGADRFALIVNNVTPGLDRGFFRLAVTSGPEASPTTEFTSWGAGGLWDLPGSGTIELPFGDFPTTDFTQVQAIQIDIGRFEPGHSLTLGGIMTTPEPTACILLALGAALLRRR